MWKRPPLFHERILVLQILEQNLKEEHSVECPSPSSEGKIIHGCSVSFSFSTLCVDLFFVLFFFNLIKM